jgi:uncharacterized membrane protein
MATTEFAPASVTPNASPDAAEDFAPELTPVRRDTTRLAHVAVGIVTVGCLAFYLVHALVAQATYYTTGYDLGIFDQAVRAYSHFKAPMVPLKGTGYNIFGDHFHPIIALLAPLYWIWDSPNMLLIAQAVLTAATIPVVYRFTRRRTGDAFSVLVAAAFGLGWPIQGLIDFDFHEVAFATPFMALAIDALDRRDDRRLIIWCALLLLVREDMGILVMLLGLLRLIQRRPNRRLVLGLIVGGIVMYVLTTSVIIPHFAAGHSFSYGNQFGALGNSVPAALGNIVTQPWHAVHVFFTPFVKTKTLAFLLLPLGLLPLRSPYAILALPLMAERFFNSRSNLWGATFHYNALPWLILVLAMVDGAQRAGFFDRDIRNLKARGLTAALSVLLIATPLSLPYLGHWDKVLPITKLRQNGPLFAQTGTHEAQAVIGFLPHDVCVAADNHLAPHLTVKDWTTVPQSESYLPDFYALNMKASDTGGNPPAPTPFAVLIQAQGEGYTIAFRSGPFIVLQSPDYTGPSKDCAPLGPGKPVPDSGRSSANPRQPS